MAITAEDMRAKMLTLQQAQDRFAATEPLSEISFATDATSKVKFKLGPAWNVGLNDHEGTDVVDAEVSIGNVAYQLTKDAILEATSLIGLTKQYVERTPGNLISPHLDYWYKNGATERKLLANGNTGHAFTKASIHPFSNLTLLNDVAEKAQEHFGTDDILVDFKFWHSLRESQFRVVVPDNVRDVRTGDPWSTGVHVTNSLVGEKPLSLNGYFFRWVCGNGAISVHASSGNYNRRTQGQGDEAYEWARAQIDEILGGLEGEMDSIQAMTDEPLEGEIADVLANIFTTYKVPLAVRQSIMEAMADSSDLTAYGIMQAVTQAANDGNLSPAAERHLLQIGGALPHVLTTRCSQCHRITAI